MSKHFDRWRGSAPAAEHCERCYRPFTRGEDFLVGKSVQVADVHVCSDACAFAELAEAGLVQARTRTETVPVPFLAEPGASKRLAKEWMAEMARRPR